MLGPSKMALGGGECPLAWAFEAFACAVVGPRGRGASLPQPVREGSYAPSPPPRAEG